MKLKYLKNLNSIIVWLGFCSLPFQLRSLQWKTHRSKQSWHNWSLQSKPGTLASVLLSSESIHVISPFTFFPFSFFHPRAHIDRVKKAEGVETDEKECPAAEPEAEPEAGGAMVITNITLLTITITNITPPQAMVTSNTTFLTIATTILAIFQLSHL